MERTISLDTNGTLWASIEYADTDTRGWLKGRGYRWSGAQRSWSVRLPRGERYLAEVAELLGQGFRIEAGSPLDAAKIVAKFDLPTPCPVRVYASGNDTWESENYQVTSDSEQGGWHSARVLMVSEEFRAYHRFGARA